MFSLLKSSTLVHLCLILLSFASLNNSIRFTSVTATFPDVFPYFAPAYFMPVVYIGEGMNEISRIYVRTSQVVIDRWLLQYPQTYIYNEEYPCLDITINSSNVAVCKMYARPLGSIHEFNVILNNGSIYNVTIAGVFPPPKFWKLWITNAYNFAVDFSNIHWAHFFAIGVVPPTPSGEILFYLEGDTSPDVINIWPGEQEYGQRIDVLIEDHEEELKDFDEQVTMHLVAYDEHTSYTFTNPYYVKHVSYTTILALVIVGVFTIITIALSIYVYRRRKAGLDKSTYSRVGASGREVEEERVQSVPLDEVEKK